MKIWAALPTKGKALQTALAKELEKDYRRRAREQKRGGGEA